jgi:bla regulator protein blaR1
MISVIFITLFLTCLISVGTLQFERRAVRRERSRSVWVAAMLCSVAVSLPPLYHACTRAFDAIASPPSGGVWPNAPWPPDRVHAASLFRLCWILMSITLLQAVAYDIGRPYVILRRLKKLDFGSALIYVSESSGPLTFGFIKPRIVIPRYFLELDSQTQELILAHEREHIAERDWLLKFFGLLLVACIPWNPVLYWQLARLTRAIELDCDARVLGKLKPADRRSYVNCLLEMSERLSRLGKPKSLLMQRIRVLTLQGT